MSTEQKGSVGVNRIAKVTQNGTGHRETPELKLATIGGKTVVVKGATTSLSQTNVEHECPISEETKNMDTNKASLFYKKRKDLWVVLDREFGASNLLMPKFKAERPRRAGWVQCLVIAMKRGEFCGDIATIIHIHCRETGQTLLVNGQHISTAVVYMPSWWKTEVRLIEYVVDTEEEVRRLYTIIDRGAPRTTSHIIVCRLLNLNKFKGSTDTMLKSLMRGFRYFRDLKHKSPGAKGGLSIDQVADEMADKEHQLCASVGAFLLERNVMDNAQTNPAKHFRKAPIYGAIMATFKATMKCAKAKQASTAFWTDVLLGSAPKEAGYPSFVLRHYVENQYRAGLTEAGGETIFRACILAWNAYRKGDPIMKFKDSELKVRELVSE